MKISILTVALLFTPVIALSGQQQIRLNDVQGRVILLKQLTNMLVPSVAPSNRVCVSPNGEQADVLEQVSNPDASVIWLHIKVTTGICMGQIGWVNADSAQISQ